MTVEETKAKRGRAKRAIGNLESCLVVDLVERIQSLVPNKDQSLSWSSTMTLYRGLESKLMFLQSDFDKLHISRLMPRLRSCIEV